MEMRDPAAFLLTTKLLQVLIKSNSNQSPNLLQYTLPPSLPMQTEREARAKRWLLNPQSPMQHHNDLRTLPICYSELCYCFYSHLMIRYYKFLKWSSWRDKTVWWIPGRRDVKGDEEEGERKKEALRREQEGFYGRDWPSQRRRGHFSLLFTRRL